MVGENEYLFVGCRVEACLNQEWHSYLPCGTGRPVPYNLFPAIPVALRRQKADRHAKEARDDGFNADRHALLCVNIFYKGVIEDTLIDLMDERIVPSITPL